MNKHDDDQSPTIKQQKWRCPTHGVITVTFRFMDVPGVGAVDFCTACWGEWMLQQGWRVTPLEAEEQEEPAR